MSRPTADEHMKMQKLAATEQPQTLTWLAMHACYSHKPDSFCPLSEYKAGLAVVERLLAGGKGHWSPLEQPSISMLASYVPHDAMQQLRTHRHLSFSVQSFRYSSKQFEDYDGSVEALHRLVYFREPGTYAARAGGTYEYTKEQLLDDMTHAHFGIKDYQNKLKAGVAPEHARQTLPFALRQHFVVGGNLRAWLHMLDLRLKADVQPELLQLAQQALVVLSEWSPQVLHWYKNNRAGKALLSP